MINKSKLILAAALGVLAISPVAGHALEIGGWDFDGAVQVRLPSGETITYDNQYNLYRDGIFSKYDEYYFDHDHDYYVVYNDDAPPPWAHKHWKKRHPHGGSFCPPGQAKKGNC